MTMARRRVPSSGFRPTQESAPVGQYDWGLIALFLMLLCIGLLMVLSASGVVAERINGDKYFFFKRQLIYAVIGGVSCGSCGCRATSCTNSSIRSCCLY